MKRKNVDNKFIVEGISFETAHGKLKIMPGKKLVVCGISTKRRKFPILEFFETKQQKRMLRGTKEILSIN